MALPLWRKLFAYRSVTLMPKNMIKETRALALLVFVALSTPFAFAQSSMKRPANGNWGFDMSGMDLSVRPGDDFYRYANGAWVDHAAIPADRTVTGAFPDLRFKAN